MERVAGIEPAYSAWKADVLPLNYTRTLNLKLRAGLPTLCAKHFTYQTLKKLVEGGGFEPPKLTRQIYSLIPLTTREPLQNERDIVLV